MSEPTAVAQARAGPDDVARLLSMRSLRSPTITPRVAFLGTAAMLFRCAPSSCASVLHASFAVGDRAGADAVLERASVFDADVSVVLDPLALPATAIESLPGVTLGVLTGAPAGSESMGALGGLDRLVSCGPAPSGAETGPVEIWRAIPPPVGDVLFAEVRSLHTAPRAMSLGSSTSHREAMLMPSKHHHDLLQVVHGVGGEMLAGLLREYDVGVYLPREWGGAFGWQAGMHLAAGHLLLAEPLAPAHGLELDIDYLKIESPDALAHVLERLRRFPEMYQRVRVRGRLKAEYFRASRVFARIVHDLLLDVAAFGGRSGSLS